MRSTCDGSLRATAACDAADLKSARPEDEHPGMTPMEYLVESVSIIHGWRTVYGPERSETAARSAYAELQLQFPTTRFRLMTRPYMDWLDISA